MDRRRHLGRLLPAVRTFIALPADIARMTMLPFQLYTFADSWPWCYALAYGGYLLGEYWESDPRLRAALHRFDIPIIGLLALGLGWFVSRHLRGRRKLEPCDYTFDRRLTDSPAIVCPAQDRHNADPPPSQH